MFVGLDVHKDSIDVAPAPGGQAEVRANLLDRFSLRLTELLTHRKIESRF